VAVCDYGPPLQPGRSREQSPASAYPIAGRSGSEGDKGSGRRVVMRYRSWPLVLAATATVLAGCTSSTARSTSPLVSADCFHGKVRPGRIVLACGDGNAVAEVLRWSRWSTSEARGVGTISQNDCDPACVSGTFRDYPATLILSEPVKTNVAEYLVRLTITYRGASPFGQRVQVVKLCWDHPPTSIQPRCPADLQGS
jgi:hypothetical protein